VARFNLLGWFLVIVCTGMLGAGLELTGQPDAFYRSQGYIVVTASAVLLAWPLVLWRLRSGKARLRGKFSEYLAGLARIQGTGRTS